MSHYTHCAQAVTDTFYVRQSSQHRQSSCSVQPYQREVWLAKMCRSMLSPCENWKLEYSYYYCARGHTAFAILIYSTDISKNKGTGRLVYDCSSFFIGLKSVVESSIFCLDSCVREENCILWDVDPNLCPSLESDYEDVWPQPSQPSPGQVRGWD